MLTDFRAVIRVKDITTKKIRCCYVSHIHKPVLSVLISKSPSELSQAVGLFLFVGFLMSSCQNQLMGILPSIAPEYMQCLLNLCVKVRQPQLHTFERHS